jgi:hypothetical protein
MMLFRNATAGLLMAVAGLTATADARAESGCQFTQGYWQNRAQNAGDLSTDVWLTLRYQPFYLSGLTYQQVLQEPSRGNAYWILGHQLVAAQANYTLGAQTPTLVSDALSRASQLMALYTPAQIAAMPKSSEPRQEMIAVSRVLDDWNNGLIGTGTCIDGNGGTNG